MSIHIDNNSFLSDVVRQFTLTYPDLKLEFIFSGEENLNFASSLLHSFPYVQLKEISTDGTVTAIDLHDDMTIKEAENILQKQLHLPASIFINIGGDWQKSKKTGSLKLRHQKQISDVRAELI